MENRREEHRRRASPIYKVQHLGPRSEEKDGRTLCTFTGLASNYNSLDQTSRPLQFKDVAGVVQTLQSAAKAFSTSREMRDFAYKEWLAKKEAKKVEKVLKKSDETVVTNEEKRKREVSNLE